VIALGRGRLVSGNMVQSSCYVTDVQPLLFMNLHQKIEHTATTMLIETIRYI